MLVETLLTMRTQRESVLNLSADAHKEYGSSLPTNACKFSGRCKYAFERCRGEHPVLTEIKDGRSVACFKYE
jgi:ABC-type dipeptide/oligopeptide/nickel transport system ATPase component